jgi:hypothetical protein
LLWSCLAETVANFNLFRLVVPTIGKQATYVAPCCVISPVTDDENKAVRTNRSRTRQYKFGVGFVLADGPEKNLIRPVLQGLWLREKFQEVFGVKDGKHFVYEEVPGHYETDVIRGGIGFSDLTEGEGIFHFVTGLTLECSVKE